MLHKSGKLLLSCILPKELTFMESGHEKTFMFAQSNTFIQLDGPGIKTFQLR